MLYQKNAWELAELLSKKEITAVEITESFMQRTKAVDGQVGAFLMETSSTALDTAKAVDTALAKGEHLSPLAGIPIALKDNICTKGITTTCASKMLENFVPPYDAFVAEKVKEHQMPMLGKLNLDEFAMGSSCENSAFKITRNPHDLSRVPGGSSGGSGAAVAAGEVPLALGSDTGGSVRLPACLTGIVGLKPSYGAISRYGVVAFGSSLDQIGPMGRSVRDVAMLFDALAVHDPKDSTSMDKYKGDIAKNLNPSVKGLKIGIPKQFFGEGIDLGVLESILQATKTYEAMGATLVPMDLPLSEYGLSTYYIVSSAEAASNLSRFDGIKYGFRGENCKDVSDVFIQSRSQGFGDEVKRRIMLGTYVLASGYYDAYYKKAQQMRAKLKQIYNEAFQTCDLLLTPTSPTTAFKIGEKANDPLQMYLSDICTVSINMVELPALAVPCDFVEGLPCGFQLIGKKFDERTLLNTAYAYETHTGRAWQEPKLV